MVCVSVVLHVKKEDEIATVRDLLAEHGRLSRDEPGCLRFEILHSQSDAKVFLLNERWESERALDAHRNASAFHEIYEPQVLPRVEREAHIGTLVE